jgi:hypothetical protein
LIRCLSRSCSTTCLAFACQATAKSFAAKSALASSTGSSLKPPIGSLLRDAIHKKEARPPPHASAAAAALYSPACLPACLGSSQRVARPARSPPGGCLRWSACRAAPIRPLVQLVGGPHASAYSESTHRAEPPGASHGGAGAAASGSVEAAAAADAALADADAERKKVQVCKLRPPRPPGADRVRLAGGRGRVESGVITTARGCHGAGRRSGCGAATAATHCPGGRGRRRDRRSAARRVQHHSAE